MRNFRILAISSLAVAGLAFGGCEKRAPTADEQGKGYVPSSTPTDRVPSDLDKQPVSGTETSAVPSGSTDLTTTTSDISWTTADGTRGTIQDSAMLSDIQQKMKAAGVYHGDVDGHPSPELAASIRDFQKKQGLTETGTLDRQTAEAMGLDWSKFSTASGEDKTFGNTLRNGADKVEDKASEIGNDVKSGEAKQDLENGAQKTGTDLENTMDRAGNRIESGAKDIGSDVKSGAEKAGDRIESGAKDIGSDVKSGAEKAGDRIQKGVDDVKSDTNNQQ